MKRFNVIFFTLILLLITVGLLLFSLNLSRVENTSPTDYVQIDDLRYCGVELSPSKNLYKLKICGVLVSEKPSVPINMYLYKMPDDNYIDATPTGDRLLSGEFVREFELPIDFDDGLYRVAAYFYKEIVGNLEFEINNQ